MKITTKHVCGFAGATLAVTATVNAQTNEAAQPTQELEQTVLTADENIVASNDVTSEDIKLENPADLKQLFKKSPGINVNGGANMAQQTFVNGFESTQMNVTIDGASQGNLFHHQSSTLIDPSLLKSVEVLPGAGSALDGPGALAGSIRYETKNVFDYLPYTSGVQLGAKGPVNVEYDRFGSDSKATYYSNGEGYGLSQTIYGKFTPEWGYLLSGSYTDRDEYEDGEGNTVDNSGFTQAAGLFKLSGRLQNGHSIDLGIDYFQNETLAYDRVNIASDYLTSRGRSPGVLQQMKSTRTTATLDYEFAPDNNELVNLEANLFYTDQDLEREETQVTSAVETLGLDLRNTFNFWKLASTFGFDYQDKTGSADYGPADASWNPTQDQSEQIFGFYNQNILSVHEQVDLSFGVRYDNYDYTGGWGEEHSSDKFSPNASIIWRPSDSLTVDAGYSEAYRGVGIREAYMGGAYASNTEAEEANTLKANIAYDDGTFFGSGSIYQQEIDNYIEPTGGGNLGDISTQGYEVSLGFRTNGFTTTLAVADTTPEINGIENAEVYGTVVAGRRWLADFNYAHGDTGLGLGYFIEYRESVDAEYLDYPPAYTKDSYALSSLYLTWDVQQVEGLNLQLNVDNLFDKQYMDQTVYAASGLASPGRQFRISANYTF
ncbi:TonB-dependent receptor plug domain-containing protein [Rubritalea spongiae]|uniref:TonB-dependent receptor plug domain-containing protein n=1 Tax=Rubritalea spongiae TaxID=430797 RepID=A0ABW5E031_9BACT